MSDAWAIEPPSTLTDAETELVERARALLTRTHYDGEDAADVPERVFDARAVADGLLELAYALDAERTARVAIQQARERLASKSSPGRQERRSDEQASAPS